MKKFLTTHRGFTLFEMMIVLTIVAILMAIGMFPYAQYMRRAALSTSVDTVAQEWVLAHKEVRNGILYSGSTDTTTDRHGYILIEFKKNSDTIGEYLLSSGSVNSVYDDKKLFKTLTLDYGAVVLGFSWDTLDALDTVRYLIAPPYASGAFLDTRDNVLPITRMTLTVGYPWGTTDNGMAKNILLVPYLQ